MTGAVRRSPANGTIRSRSIETEVIQSHALAVVVASLLTRVGGINIAKFDIAVTGTKADGACTLAAKSLITTVGGSRSILTVRTAFTGGADSARGKFATLTANRVIITIFTIFDHSVSTFGLEGGPAVGNHVASGSQSHGGGHFIANFLLIVGGMKLVFALQLSIAIIHDSSG